MILLKRGDITHEKVDGIVNAANSGLRGGGGVDGAIHKAAGPSVMEACRRIGGCPTGSAVLTDAGNLPAKKILHAVGPVWHGGKQGEAALLKSCYVRCFELACAEGLRTLAFPAISTGVYHYPVEEAAVIALSAGLQFESQFDQIRYICFSEGDLQTYEKVWHELQGER